MAGYYKEAIVCGDEQLAHQFHLPHIHCYERLLLGGQGVSFLIASFGLYDFLLTWQKGPFLKNNRCAHFTTFL